MLLSPILKRYRWNVHIYFLYFFFFKQKTAYEMRISDWSSDVCSSDLLLLKLRDVVVPSEFAQLVGRRVDGEPVAYIVGTRDFWTITLQVTPAVLIPRPDTETLLEAAVEHFGRDGPRRILDLGTGSGAL